jgi:hypothetical protein
MYRSQPVTDFLSNFNDQMVNAAHIVGRSEHRQAIFEKIYRGPKQIKTIQEIMGSTGLTQVHVLKEGGKMAGLLIDKVPGGYKKKKEFATRYRDILAMARSKKKRDNVPTKIAPKGNAAAVVQVTFPRPSQNAKFVSIDDIDSFAKVRKQPQAKSCLRTLPEVKLKRAFSRMVGERGSFKDWGGEKSDLYTTRLRFHGKRVPAAIAFKGKATKGILVPKKMGKNGDQINRLFDEPAQVFLVVYGRQIHSAIVSQMKAFAIGNALQGRRVYYGVVDGMDLSRLASAYPSFF